MAHDDVIPRVSNEVEKVPPDLRNGDLPIIFGATKEGIAVWSC